MSTGRYAGPHSQHSGCNCAINLSASSCPVHRVSYPVGFHAPTLSKIIVESQSTITCVHSSGKRVIVNLDKIKLRRQGWEFREAGLPVLEELFDDILQTFRNLAPMQDGPESLKYHMQ